MRSDGSTPFFVLRTCEHCGKEFRFPTYRMGRTGRGRFCSIPCRIARQQVLALGDRASRAKTKARNRAFVAEINARTVCAHCGQQPVEWHNPEHVTGNRHIYRIGNLAHGTMSIATIQAEMARCTPLCRRCHMAEDGRLRNFEANRYLEIGAKHGSAKLTENDVREIRALRAGGTSAAALALQYGVAAVTVRHIVSRRKWTHI